MLIDSFVLNLIPLGLVADSFLTFGSHVLEAQTTGRSTSFPESS